MKCEDQVKCGGTKKNRGLYNEVFSRILPHYYSNHKEDFCIQAMIFLFCPDFIRLMFQFLNLIPFRPLEKLKN